MEKLSRRKFLKLTAGGGTFIAAGFGEKTVNKLIPYIIPPEQIKPGEWTLYATTCRECPAGCGMYLRHRGGRVVNAMGNPQHPINKGGLCPRGQSAVQGLYDPDRLKKTLCAKCNSEMDDPTGPIDELASILKNTKGKVIIISDLQTGALYEVMDNFVNAFGSKGQLYLYEPFNYQPLRQANEELFGINAIPEIHFEETDYIISFSADFLESWINNVQFAQQFSEMHSYKDKKMGYMTYVGPRFSMTAANADDFLQVPANSEYLAALAMLNSAIEQGWVKDSEKIKPIAQAFSPAKLKIHGITEDKIAQMAEKFFKAGSSVALAGPTGASGLAAQNLSAAVALLNYAAGRIGQTIDFSRVHALSRTITNEQLTKVLSELTDKDVLFIHNVNLAYCVQGAAEYISRAGTRIYVGTMPDETSRLVQWILPANSPLESWGDYEPWTGMHCLMQPTMAKLHNTRMSGDYFLAIAKSAGKALSRNDNKQIKNFEEWLKFRWQELHTRIAPTNLFTDFWQQSLRNGGAIEIPQKVSLSLKENIEQIHFPRPENIQTDNCQLWLWPSIMLFDGRVSNRGWLQETAEPMSGIVWGNTADIHPKKALELGLSNKDEIEINTRTGKIHLPVRITEDVSENIVAVSFGQGHKNLGSLAAWQGANAFEIIDCTDSNSIFGTATITKAVNKNKSVYLVNNQNQYKRELMQWVSLSNLNQMKQGEGDKLILPLPEGYNPKTDVYPPHKYEKHRWAMVIDLLRCIGCGACTVACYAENNIAVMGKRPLERWLEMTWLRIIPYRCQEDNKRLGFLPMLCQHCDTAPCEPVCPVFASVHNDEGLNAQVYNRCIGTRYCSNNCPYKVRRFNWLNVEWKKPLDLQLNPDVSVRVRGVMEKCTFCIQRIRAAEKQAKTEHRQVRDGEIQPACLQSCPAKVFTFGDLLDPNSKVSQLTRSDPRRYHVLEELNTKPAITYLRRIKNDV